MIGRRIGAEPVEEDLRGPKVVVDARVEKGAGIAGPDDGSVAVLDDIRAFGAAGQIAPADAVQFIAALVAGIGEQAMVRRMDGVAEAEKILALRQRVAVEEDVLVAAAMRPCGRPAHAALPPGSGGNRANGRRAPADRNRSRRRAPPFPR